jgi:hypothetical protein
MFSVFRGRTATVLASLALALVAGPAIVPATSIAAVPQQTHA